MDGPTHARRIRRQTSQLPHAPRKRNEYESCRKLSGAGSVIAGAVGGRDLQASVMRHCDGSQRSTLSTPTTEATLQRSSLSTPCLRRSAGMADHAAAANPPHSGPNAFAEFSCGGDELLRRLADLHAANRHLRGQFDVQSREVSELQEAGRAQQQALREYKGQLAERQQAAVAEAEARVAAQFRSELEEQRRLREEAIAEAARERSALVASAAREREELLARLDLADQERLSLQEDLEQVQNRASGLEAEVRRLAPEAAKRAMAEGAVEMELDLVRSRLAREVANRQLAESDAAAARAQREAAQSALQRSEAERHTLQKRLLEQRQQANFREEVVEDMRLGLQNERADTERKLKCQRSQSEKTMLEERSRRAAVARLENIVPKVMIKHALF